MEDISNVAGENMFRRASIIEKKVGVENNGQDFSFMKKRVRVNNVEKDVCLYQLDQDEIDAKRRKGKKFV